MTRGFKLYAGFGLASLIAALLYGLSSVSSFGPDYLQVIDRSAFEGVISLGWQGSVGEHSGYVIFLVVAAVSFLFAFMLAAFRDADPKSVAEISEDGELPPAQAPTAPSYWPVIVAFGLGVTIIGIATSAAIMGIGLVFVGAAMLEWAISAWADRISADPAVNKTVRNRLLWPFEVPVVGAAGMAVLVIGLWRVFLAVSKFSALWVATGVAAAVFLAAVIFAMAPKIGKAAVAAVLTIGAIGIITAGIISAAVGSRDFHEIHPAGHSDSVVQAEGGGASGGEEGDH